MTDRLPFGRLNNQQFAQAVPIRRSRRQQGLAPQQEEPAQPVVRRSRRIQGQQPIQVVQPPPQEQVVVGQPIITRQRRSANWRANEVPLDEPGIFRNRLMFTHDAQLMIPDIPPRTLEIAGQRITRAFRQRQNEDWSDVWPVLTAFAKFLQAILRNRGATSIRIYLVHNNNDLEIVNPAALADRIERGTHFQLTRGWPKRVAEALAGSLNQFLLHYDEQDRDLEETRVYVDVAYENQGGGARNGIFPQELKHCKAYLWNPSSGRCFHKCLRQSLNLSLQQITETLKDVEDFDDYHEVFQITVQQYPKITLKLFGVDGRVRHRQDGAEYEQHINLLLFNSHYYLITRLDKFVESCNGHKHHCIGCDKQFKELDAEHQCEDWRHCPQCNLQFMNRAEEEEHKHMQMLNEYAELQCQYCERRGFQSTACLDYHRLNCSARLAQRKLQLLRARQQRYEESHRDERREAQEERREVYYQCKICGKRILRTDTTHVHYLEKRELPKELKFQHWYAFDYESLLIPHTSLPNNHIHKVNLVCVQKLFVRPEQRFTFKTIEEFLQWMRDTLVPLDEPVAMIAHNLKGYDGRLTLAKLFEQQSNTTTGFAQEMIWTGAKINVFKWNNITFRDSLLHIAQPLASFPKVFGLQEMAKGYFPYLFSTPENQQYVGTMPDIHYFQPEFKSPKDRKEFLKWYDEHKNDHYDFQQELLKYCQSDVDILAKGLEIYNQAGVVLNHELLPPLERLTIASYTTNVWWTLHFPENTIAYHNAHTDKNARDALRGGRTDVRQFYKKFTIEQVFEQGKYLKYVDVQSMYPYVMHTQQYPVGRPTVYTGSECTEQKLRDSFGFVCVDIDPPVQYVHHPALVHKKDNKLVATLEPWNNTTFTTVEILDALDQGWRLKKIYWIQDYADKSDTLFKEYISLLVAQKIHSSSDPPPDFDELAQRWEQRFGVKLDRSKMRKNPGLRALAKLMLNSLWGKISERYKNDFCVNVNSAEFRVYEQKEYLGDVKLTQKLRLGNDSWLLTGQREDLDQKTADWDKKQKEHRQRTSVAIGSYVTMWGRRMLWQEMERLGSRVVYHDTDSIIYEYDQNAMYNTPTGDLLGDWEEELDGRPIIEFVALAPKTYGYRYLATPVDIPEDASLEWYQQYTPYEVYQGKLYPVKEELKVKGFKLHHDARTAITFDGLLDLLRGRKTIIQANQLNFSYTKQTQQIQTNIMRKQLKFEYEKGLIGANDRSYPFGAQNYWDPHTQAVAGVDP